MNMDLVIRNKYIYYILKCIYPKYPLYSFPLFIKLCVLYHSIYKRRYCIKLKIQAVPTELYNKLVNQSSVNNIICDRGNVMVVSRLVYNYLTIDSPYGWVSVIPNGHVVSDKFHPRIVQIIPSDYCSTNHILVTENNFFNINKYFNTQEISSLTLKSCKNGIPTLANDLVISFITSPLEAPMDLVDSALATYFHSPKLVYVDDIYEIALNAENAGNAYYKNIQLCNLLPSVYFKCINLCGVRKMGVGYFVVKGLTAIQEKQNMLSMLPKKKIIYHDKTEINGNNIYDDLKCNNYGILNKCPDGLSFYYNKLCESISSFIENHCMMHMQPVFLVQGPIGIGKNVVIDSVASSLGMQLYKIDCSELACVTSGQSEAKVKYVFDKVKMASPVILCLQNFEIFGLDHENELDIRLVHYFQNELKLLLQNNDYPVIVVATCNSKSLAPTLQRIFLETILMKAPSEREREQLLEWVLKKHNIAVSDKVITSLASKTAGFLFEDLKLLVLNTAKTIVGKDNVVEEKHFDVILEQMQNSYRDSIGAPKVPKVKWSDIGGLADLKEEIIKSMQTPSRGLDFAKTRRSGILLYGPPGTGKTLLAKAIATESNFNFLSVKGPELLNMYVGQSEQNVRDVFERARAATPCVIFFDELDSLAPNRGAKGDSGGVMDSIVAQLLSEMDGIGNDNATHTLFIVGATNRPDLLDPALLRPGRLDKLLYVGLCETISSKCTVLNTILNKFNLSPDVNIESIAAKLLDDVSGADLHSICSKAWMNAVRRLLQNSNKDKDSRHPYTPNDVEVTMEDFEISLRDFVPSVNQKDMAYFRQMRQQGEKEKPQNKRIYDIEQEFDQRASS